MPNCSNKSRKRGDNETVSIQFSKLKVRIISPKVARIELLYRETNLPRYLFRFDSCFIPFSWFMGQTFPYFSTNVGCAVSSTGWGWWSVLRCSLSPKSYSPPPQMMARFEAECVKCVKWFNSYINRHFFLSIFSLIFIRFSSNWVK